VVSLHRGRWERSEGPRCGNFFNGENQSRCVRAHFSARYCCGRRITAHQQLTAAATTGDVAMFLGGNWQLNNCPLSTLQR
jgi:hypothetical protein